MASNWRSSLLASERYDAIQNIQAARGLSMSEAVALEQRLYYVLASKDEYLSACRQEPSHEEPAANHEVNTTPLDDSSDTGIRIGQYDNCSPVADGLTSEVYRCGNKALKVIVNHHQNMEPHNPQREVRVLEALRTHLSIIELLDVFRDQEQRLVLMFPYMPLTLADLFSKGAALPKVQTSSLFTDILRGLEYIHAQGVIHRDIKPSAILLASPSGPAYLSDFGTAWHPSLSLSAEPPDTKVLDVGTGPYRSPETLFGDRSYGPPVDMWGVGVMLSEAICCPHNPVFESRPAHEDGNQLGLILSIFKTLGTPTPNTWPEAKGYKVTPFELWTVFPQRPWEEILPDVDPDFRDLVAALVRFDGRRATANKALQFRCLVENCP